MEAEISSSEINSLSSNPYLLSSNPDPLSSNPPLLSSNPSENPLRRNFLNELPGELAARVGALGKRRPPQEVQELIVDLCRQREWRAEDLALLLGRNPETLRQNYLRPLLRDGRISMTNPEKPNDPDQAYHTI